MPELANDAEQLGVYEALRVQLMHKWYMKLCKELHKQEIEYADETG